MELIAEAGSGVPEGCRLYPEKPEDAEVGLLFLPSAKLKLSARECPLPSLAPLAGLPVIEVRFGLEALWLSCGVWLPPEGVANRSEGGAGRADGRWICANGGRSGTGLLFDTGFWFGDGGMARPRRGVREPLFIPPGMGGRRRGVGEGVEAWEIGNDSGLICSRCSAITEDQCFDPVRYVAPSKASLLFLTQCTEASLMPVLDDLWYSGSAGAS